MGKRVIELIRVSTEGQAQDDRGGIPAQREANRRTAQAHGLEIVRTIQIEDVSGSRVLASSEMQELLRLIESPEIVGVVAREFSRLMRPEDLGDFAILQRFIETRTVLYLPDGPVDLSNKSGRLFGVIKAAFAGYERQEIIERMTSGKEAIRRAGRHAGGANLLPFGVGYTRDKGFFYKPEVEKIREAFRLVATTSLPYAQIAERLNLPRTSLRCILQNPIWIGERVYDKKRDSSAAGYVAGANGRQGYRRKVAREEGESIRVKVMEGLISPGLFAQVQTILANRAARERTIRSKNAPQYLFNGFLRCGRCESPLYPHTNNNGKFGRDGRHYYCKLNGTRARRRDPESACPTPYIMAAKIEPKIEEMFAVRLQDEEVLESIAEAYVAESTRRDPEPDIGSVSRQIETLTEKRSRILDAFYDGVIDRTERDRRVGKVDADLAAYKAIAAQQRAPEALITAEALAEVLSVFAEMPFLGRDDKRALLRSAGAEVYVEGYTIRLLKLSNLPQPHCTDTHTDNPRRAAGA